MCLAVPGQIVRVMEPDEAPRRAGAVRFGGIVKDVDLSLVPEACSGDFVLVHVGVALCRVDEVEAERVFEMLREMGGLDEVEAAGEDGP
jgi:hydrogenase expression/formation protein HypC